MDVASEFAPLRATLPSVSAPFVVTPFAADAKEAIAVADSGGKPSIPGGGAISSTAVEDGGRGSPSVEAGKVGGSALVSGIGVESPTIPLVSDSTGVDLGLQHVSASIARYLLGTFTRPLTVHLLVHQLRHSIVLHSFSLLSRLGLAIREAVERQIASFCRSEDDGHLLFVILVPGLAGCAEPLGRVKQIEDTTSLSVFCGH